jgi:hypothetical protein
MYSNSKPLVWLSSIHHLEKKISASQGVSKNSYSAGNIIPINISGGNLIKINFVLKKD